ncbi:putative periplasmic protein [hydrothermal vent metagenome]|uniref:Putative periplasmic protein n=1 Tax=hydrothermal vent metagenome TaxID=652676 RepID=A0A1W1C1J6_9ZZZZ
MIRVWLLISILFLSLFGAHKHFSIYKKEGNIKGNTLLVIGGIHGNEPGGYFAPSILASRYKIIKGALWVVPNLNFDSDLRNRRGIYGDMNRKFAYIKPNDKDFIIIKDIKKIILNPKVDLILNLHDGHGFYREAWENSIFNPSAWGQACIIDQKNIDSKKFGRLSDIANSVAKELNQKLVKNRHIFNVKNTHTKFKDEQMRLSLTYFAIIHNKPAFAIETSKNIKQLYQKVFYQLRAIEGFMRKMGIKYSRDFKLNPVKIKKILRQYGVVTINGNTIINLDDVKPKLRYFPIKKRDNKIKGENPLLAILKRGRYFDVMIGNKKITTLVPDYKKQERCLKRVPMIIDGQKKSISVPSIVEVADSFSTNIGKKYRINVIGFSKKGIKNENSITIKKKDIASRYAMDSGGRKFRIEIYHQKRYCGMVVVNFKR